MKFYRRTSEKPVRTRYFQATTTPTSARTPLQPLRTREALTPPTRTTTRTTTPPPLASLICTKWGRSGTPANPFQLHFAATLATPVQNNFPFTCCNAAKIHNCAHTHTRTYGHIRWSRWSRVLVPSLYLWRCCWSQRWHVASRGGYV